MNVLQRGVRSVLRKPIKSIILLFIVIVMSGLFLGAMASRSASIYTQDATRQAIGATFRIEGNEENRRKRLDQARLNDYVHDLYLYVWSVHKNTFPVISYLLILFQWHELLRKKLLPAGMPVSDEMPCFLYPDRQKNFVLWCGLKYI